jgi:hypothetical protein
MTIPLWLQRRLARAFPSIFLVPVADILAEAEARCSPLVHPDHPVRIGGAVHFARGDRTDAEFRAFILKTMADAAEPANNRHL